MRRAAKGLMGLGTCCRQSSVQGETSPFGEKEKKKNPARKTCWFLWCQSCSFWGLDFISAEVGFTTDFKSPVFLLL